MSAQTSLSNVPLVDLSRFGGADRRDRFVQDFGEAVREFGFVRGTVLAAWRILRCNPWSHGGVDYARDQRIFPLWRRS